MHQFQSTRPTHLRHVQPPRCHHCAACKQCVLRRDHHCFFVGTCIGHWNQRHFIALLFHTALGTLHSLGFLHYFLARRFTFDVPTSATTAAAASAISPLIPTWVRPFLLPLVVIDWLLGHTGFFTVFMDTIFLLIVASTLSSVFFGCTSMHLALRGQTSYEAIKTSRHQDNGPPSTSLRPHQRGFLNNWRQVFGSWGLLQFVCPLPFISLPNDGLFCVQRITV